MIEIRQLSPATPEQIAKVRGLYTFPHCADPSIEIDDNAGISEAVDGSGA